MTLKKFSPTMYNETVVIIMPHINGVMLKEWAPSGQIIVGIKNCRGLKRIANRIAMMLSRTHGLSNAASSRKHTMAGRK